MSNISVRQLNPQCNSDIADGRQILHQAYVDAWPEQRFRNNLSTPNYGGLLGGIKDDSGIDALPCGALIYHCDPSWREIVGLGVLKDSGNQGVATGLIRALQGRVRKLPRVKGILMYVSDSCTPGHLCLKKCGFLHIKTEENFRGTGDTLYLFRWMPDQKSECGEAAAESLRMD